MTLVNGDDRKLWKQQSDYVLLLLNTHIQATLSIMIRNQEDVKDLPHLIWRRLIAFYEDYALAQANASPIGVGLTQIRTSQLNTRMEFSAKFLGEINCFNELSNENMSSSTCLLYLNIAISENKVLNSKVARIKTDVQRSNIEKTKAGKTNTVKPLSKFKILIHQFIDEAIQLYGAQMLVRATSVKSQDAKHNLNYSYWDENKALTIIQWIVRMHLSRSDHVNYRSAIRIQSIARMHCFHSDYVDYQAAASIQ